MLFIFSIYVVPVASVTLTRTPIEVLAGQKMNITCMTSYSNPPASITWYMSSSDITSQSTSKTQTEGGLVRTISSLISIAVKKDNERQVYCKANNTLSKFVTSSVQTLIVMCKFIELHSWVLVFFVCIYILRHS